MNRVSRWIPGWLPLLLAPPLLFAGAPGPAQTAQPATPVFAETLEVRVVNFEVVVTDLDNLSTAVLHVDDHLIVRYLNPAAEALLAASRTRAISKPPLSRSACAASLNLAARFRPRCCRVSQCCSA